MPVIKMNDWPPHSKIDINRRKCSVEAAKLMANAAMTAPNAGGVTQVEATLLYGMEEQEELARKMEELAWEVDGKAISRWFKYEAVMVRESDAVLLLGDFRAKDSPMDAECGYCSGTGNCSFLYDRRPHIHGILDHTKRDFDTLIDGPLCGVRVNDFGYAVGSALYMANKLMVDSRAYWTVGVASQRLGYCQDSAIQVGVLVASLAKNPYVDVNTDYHVVNLQKVIDANRRLYALYRQAGGDYRFKDPGWEREKKLRKIEEKSPDEEE